MSNNVLEFFIKMKDLMSSGLTKLAQNSKKTFTAVQGDIDKTIHQNKKLADSFDEVDRKAASSGGGVVSWGKRIAAGIGIAALVAGGAFAKQSAQAYINYEKQSKSFEVLAGNKGIGQNLAGSLNSLQQDTILGPEVFKNAQTMMGFGITAEKVVPYLKMLGDVSMGDAEKLGSLTLAFSQVSASGKLTGQDLLQFINAGFNPLNEIAKMTGRSMSDLKEEMSKGNISFDMVSKAFEHATGKGGLFNGMMNQMAETTGGKIAQLQGSFEGLQIAVGERMKGPLNSFIGGLSSLVNWTKKIVEIPVEQKFRDQITEIRALQAELTSSNTSHERQVELLHQLEQINPNIVKGINEQNIEYGKLAANINEVTGALQKKIFMETFNKDNADTLTRYAEAQETYNNSFAKSLSVVGQVAPDLAARTDLTIGQKQLLTRQRLEAQLKSGNVHSYSVQSGLATSGGANISVRSKEQDLLDQLNSSIRFGNNANSTIATLNPKIAEINKTKDALTKQIDGVLGVKSMTSTAAGIKGSGGGTGGGTSSGTSDAGKSVAGGITGGGPRVININGVTLKVAETMQLTAADPKDFLSQVEPQLEELLLRIVNSGAGVQ